MESLKAHEKKLKWKGLEKIEQVLQTNLSLKENAGNSSERSQNNQGCGCRRSQDNEGTSQNLSSSRVHERWHNLRQNERGRYDKSQIQYHIYNKFGHYAYECM